MTKNVNTLEIEDIMTLLPHRYPFLLVDRVTDYTLNESISAYKNITLMNLVLQGIFRANLFSQAL